MRFTEQPISPTGADSDKETFRDLAEKVGAGVVRLVLCVVVRELAKVGLLGWKTFPSTMKVLKDKSVVVQRYKFLHESSSIFKIHVHSYVGG